MVSIVEYNILGGKVSNKRFIQLQYGREGNWLCLLFIESEDSCFRLMQELSVIDQKVS